MQLWSCRILLTARVCIFCRAFTQALALAEKSLSELSRAAAEVTKKCDELARHKRFLDNQATESKVLADAAKRKKAAAAAAAAVAAAERAGADGDGGDEAAADEEEGEVECAVCRNPMSEELQVRCGRRGEIEVVSCQLALCFHSAGSTHNTTHTSSLAFAPGAVVCSSTGPAPPAL